MQNVTGRDGYIITKALAYAITARGVELIRQHPLAAPPD